MRIKLSFAPLVAVFFCLPAFAQYTVKDIVFKGQTFYSQAALEAAVGLKPGQALDNATLQAAAQRLGDSGSFEDLQVTLEGPIKSVSVVFTLKPAPQDKMLHVRLRNLVWWTPQELDAELHKRVPLFAAQLPEAGNVQTDVQNALTVMLAEKSVAGATVEENVEEPHPGAPYRTAIYRVSSPQILLKSLRMSGASPEMAAAVTKAIRPHAGQAYTETVAEQILDTYYDAGLLEASLSPLQHSLEPLNGGIGVTVVTSVTEGPVYHVGTLEWAGSPVVSVEQFNAENKVKPGGLASQKELMSSLGFLQDAYGKNGYIDAAIDAEPKLDKASHTASYTIKVTPGEVYHLRSMRAEGLSPKQHAEFDPNWRLKPGDVYNQDYVQTFLKKNTALQSLAGYSATFKKTADPATHEVDLVITFFKDATLTK